MLVKNNILGIIWTITIVVLCGIPGDKLPESSFLSWLPLDKIVHFGLYFILFLLSRSGLEKSNIKTAAIIAFLYCVFIGVSVEWMQSNLFNGRSGDFYDILANILGTFFAWIMYNTIANRIWFLKISAKNQK